MSISNIETGRVTLGLTVPTADKIGKVLRNQD